MENKKHKHQEGKKASDAAEQTQSDGACESSGEEISRAADKKAPDYYEQLLCLKADFENYRKRVERERPDLIRFGKSEILIKLLPLYDLLLQAHMHVTKVSGDGTGEQVQDVVKGLEMIFKEFSKVFEAEGIRPMELQGKPYDPMASEIVGICEGTEAEDGLITEECQKGFYYGDKILRPARVKIAKAKPAAKEAPGGAEEKSGK